MGSPVPPLTPLRRLWLAPVFLYRRLVSPLIGPHCRYSPSCSAYMVQAVARHGVVKGTILGIARILRCNALYTGGWDPVPEEFSLKGIRETRRRFSERLRARRKMEGAERP